MSLPTANMPIRRLLDINSCLKRLIICSFCTMNTNIQTPDNTPEFVNITFWGRKLITGKKCNNNNYDLHTLTCKLLFFYLKLTTIIVQPILKTWPKTFSWKYYNISSHFWLLFGSVKEIELIIIDFWTLRNINKQEYEFNS